MGLYIDITKVGRTRTDFSARLDGDRLAVELRDEDGDMADRLTVPMDTRAWLVLLGVAATQCMGLVDPVSMPVLNELLVVLVDENEGRPRPTEGDYARQSALGTDDGLTVTS